MNRYYAEFFGTFCLVFAGTGAAVIDGATNGGVTHVGVALTFGLVVMAMIGAIGDVSGAHINPAVTLAFTASGSLPPRQTAPYIVAQILGALAASGLLRILFPAAESLGETLPAGPWKDATWWRPFLLEMLLTFILMAVILRVVNGGESKATTAGIVIGGVVGLEALAAGPICGASMNPARSIGPAVISGHLQHLWIYIAAPIVGALLAVIWEWSLSQMPKESNVRPD